MLLELEISCLLLYVNNVLFWQHKGGFVNFKESPHLDVAALIAALNAQRESRGLSWRKLALEAGVHPSSLTRMQQGKLPDVNTFTALTHWLGLPAERFTTGAASKGQETPHPLAIASTLLRGKREMTPEALKALEELVQAAFKLSEELKQENVSSRIQG